MHDGKLRLSNCADFYIHNAYQVENGLVSYMKHIDLISSESRESSAWILSKICEKNNCLNFPHCETRLCSCYKNINMHNYLGWCINLLSVTWKWLVGRKMLETNHIFKRFCWNLGSLLNFFLLFLLLLWLSSNCFVFYNCQLHFLLFCRQSNLILHPLQFFFVQQDTVAVGRRASVEPSLNLQKK